MKKTYIFLSYNAWRKYKEKVSKLLPQRKKWQTGSENSITFSDRRKSRAYKSTLLGNHLNLVNVGKHVSIGILILFEFTSWNQMYQKKDFYMTLIVQFIWCRHQQLELNFPIQTGWQCQKGRRETYLLSLKRARKVQFKKSILIESNSISVGLHGFMILGGETSSIIHNHLWGHACFLINEWWAKKSKIKCTPVVTLNRHFSEANFLIMI